MKKLNQVKLTSTLQVQLNCSLNEQTLGNNFGIILQCLRQLAGRQDKLQQSYQQINMLQSELNNIKQINNKLINEKEKQNKSDEIGKILPKQEIKKQIPSPKEKHSSNTITQNNQIKPQQKEYLLNEIKQLKIRVGKNETSILDNIKDINIINNAIKQLNDLIHALKENINNMAIDKRDNNDNRKQNKNMNWIDQRINIKFSELKKQIQRINSNIKQHEVRIENIQKNINENNKNNSNSKDSNNQNQKLMNNDEDLKDRIDTLNKKLSIVIQDTNNNNQNIKILKEDVDYLEKQGQQMKQNYNSLKEQIEKLKLILENLNKEKDNQIKNIKNQINKFKKNNNNNNNTDNNPTNSDIKKQKLNSNTSLDDNVQDKSNSTHFNLGHKNVLYTQNKFLSKDQQGLRELRERIQILEKMINLKKGGLNEQKSNPQKLPMLRKTKYGHHGDNLEKSVSNNKKDLIEIKLQIQSWVKNYLDGEKDKINLEDLQLKFQQIRNTLSKKADQQGMKKGHIFLQNKINQLYLFLTQPDTQDAMIVRKGFNCLSCSKKVQKLRGKLGPHINWNNMTSTNYSPPRVGYSKHMGDNNGEKDSQA